MGAWGKIKKALGFCGPEASGPTPWVELWSPALGQEYKKFWNNMAKDRAGAYLAVAGEPFGKPATEESLSAHGKETAAIVAGALEIGSADRVLEVGVGVGRIAEHVAPMCKSFTGVDISDNMIELAWRRLFKQKNLRLISSPRSDLGLFSDGSFDKAFFQVVLIHLDREDAYHYIRETFRVLRPGGRVWFQFYNLLHPRGFKEFEFAVQYMIDQGAKTRGRVHCYTSVEVRFLIEQAGFVIDAARSNLEPREQSFKFQIPDLDWEFYLIAVAEKPIDG